MSDDSDISGASEDGFLAAEYALGLLSAAEHAAFASRLRSEPALRAELSLWQSRLASLDAQFAEMPPPPAAWSRIEQRLFPAALKPGFWNSLSFWRAASGVAALVAVAGRIRQLADADAVEHDQNRAPRARSFETLPSVRNSRLGARRRRIGHRNR